MNDRIDTGLAAALLAVNCGVLLSEEDAQIIASAHNAGEIDANYMLPNELRAFARDVREAGDGSGL